MDCFESELVIDLGSVGNRYEQHRFRVRLKADALWALFKDVQAAHRVYELLLIERPGDVWDYVSVVLEEAPPKLLTRVARVRSGADRTGDEGVRGQHIELPFNEFDRLFRWTGDDTEPEDEAWLVGKDQAPVRMFCRQLLAAARVVRDGLDWGDSLTRHVLDRVRADEHPYAFVPRSSAVRLGREHMRNMPIHGDAFYVKLRELLRDPELTSVAYRADGDYGVLRAMAAEQRRRAAATGHAPGIALRLSALCNQRISNDDWGSEIWFHEEGLGHGDLFIEGGGLYGASLKSLVERHGRVPGRWILSVVDDGEIAGFSREAGDGFVLYRRRSPDRRRVALEKIDSWRRDSFGPVMSFGRAGSTLHGYDKAVVVVGDSVDDAARSALAGMLAEWQQHGGDPAVLVFGDRAPFHLAGCTLLPDPRAEGVSSSWILGALRKSRPWVDVLVALEPPPWVSDVLTELVEDQADPWAPWVVSSGDTGSLRSDLGIAGDLAESLRRASSDARAKRPPRM